jgi:hypothetical protein
MEACRLNEYSLVPLLYTLLRQHFQAVFKDGQNLTKFARHTLKVTNRKSL